jgi:Domain of unknown function (DUF1508)
VAATGSDSGACDPLSRAVGYGPSKQAPTSGRAHGGQARAEAGLDGKLRFNLVATNESKAKAIKGIESVKHNAPNAEIDDQTDT